MCIEGGRDRRGEICVCKREGRSVCETSSTGVLEYIQHSLDPVCHTLPQQ